MFSFDKELSDPTALRIALSLLLIFLISGIWYILSFADIDFYSDALYYDKIARDLLSGNGYTGLRKPPLYPFFLAGVYHIFGHNPTAACIIQAFMHCAAGFIIFLTAKRVFKNNNVAVLTVFLYCTYIPFISHHMSQLLSETLAVLLLAIAFFILVIGMDQLKKLPFFISGFFFGLSALCKATILPFPLVLSLMLIVHFHKKKRFAVSVIILFMVGFVIIIVPWTFKNFIETRRFIPIATAAGYALWLGTVPENYPGEYHPGHGWLLGSIVAKQNEAVKERSFPEQDDHFKKLAVQNIKDNPITYLGLACRRFFILWFNIGWGKNPSVKSLFVATHHAALIFLTIFAIFNFRGHWLRKMLPMFLLILTLTVVHTVMWAEVRYITIVIPFLIMSASLPLYKIFRKYIFKIDD